MISRPIRFVAVAAALGLLAAGCSSNSGGSTTTSAGTPTGNISVWARDAEKDFMGKLVEQYNSTHQVQAQLTIIPSANFVQKLGTAAAAGNGPDVTSLDLVFAPYFASTGVLEDISDVYNALPYKDQLVPGHVAQSTWDGKTYALPFTGDASVLFYNKDLFQKAGLDPNKPPTTWAEIRADAKKITAIGSGTYGFTFAGACGGCNVFEFTPYIWGSGGQVLSKDGKKAMLDSPQVTDALQFYRDMQTDGSIPSAAETDSGNQQVPLFTSGKVGMTALGAFAIPSFDSAKLNYAAAPMPGKDSGTASFAGGDVISVINGTKNRAGAVDFVKWATDTQAQTWLAKNGSAPIRKDLLDSVYATQGQSYAMVAKGLEMGQVPFSVVENAIFNDNNGPWVKMIHDSVFTGNIQAAQAIAQSAAQKLIDQA